MSRRVRCPSRSSAFLVCLACLAGCGSDPGSSSEAPPVVADASAEDSSSSDSQAKDVDASSDVTQEVDKADAAQETGPLPVDGGDASQEQDAASDAPEEAPITGHVKLFSFAVMTDIHVGEGKGDYGTAGYDDSGGEEYAITDKIRAAVKKVNDAKTSLDIRFVAVLGDMSGTAERSELVKSKAILDTLEVPYLPLIGNHDIWPYTSTQEASWPNGDQVFEEVYQPQFDVLAATFPGFARAPTPVYNPEHKIQSRFINFGFKYEGHHFIALDLNTRRHAWLGEKGVLPEADLHDFAGGTWPWFTDEMASLNPLGHKNVFVLVHHPLMVTSLGLDSLSLGEDDKIGDFIKQGGYGDALFGFFAGHTHVDLTLTRYEGQKMIITPAAKEESKLRIVDVYADGEHDTGTIL